MEIITNNRPRALVSGYELTPAEAAEFDYMTPEDLAGASFVRYKGSLYDVSEFMRVPAGAFGLSNINNGTPVKGWDGYASETFFSGVLIRLDPAGDYAVMGRYFS